MKIQRKLNSILEFCEENNYVMHLTYKPEVAMWHFWITEKIKGTIYGIDMFSFIGFTSLKRAIKSVYKEIFSDNIEENSPKTYKFLNTTEGTDAVS